MADMVGRELVVPGLSLSFITPLKRHSLKLQMEVSKDVVFPVSLCVYTSVVLATGLLLRLRWSMGDLVGWTVLSYWGDLCFIGRHMLS